MRIKYILLNLFLCSFLLSIAQGVELTYYLPDISYDESITTPEEFLGHQVGEWHVTHDQLYFYMKQLASESDRILFKEIGKTHENRRLVNLIYTSPENHKNLDQLQKNHKALTFATSSKSINIDDIPVVIYQGYSIHGNESSGSNAALMNAYYLAAGQSDHVNELLDHSIIIVDPSYNPDGLQRFSTWANSHKSKNVTSDPNHREYDETWPRGRTNHYWFDLNRDWLLLTHPESKARLKVFHEWKPNILTDHHEMGSNSTFFFQPGIPARTNPNTPQKNQDLTYEIGKFHAKGLDKIGSLYYTKESFDDFYYGKGSTYPDVNGGIGILFEQASSRGHAQDTDHGLLTFPFTIRNQVATSISTQDAGLALRTDLLTFKRKFYLDAQAEAKKSSIKAYVFGNNIDHKRTNRFIEILQSHQINVHELNQDVRQGGKTFSKESSFIVPTDQQQYKLIKSVFEKVTTFRDSLFYDVSAWTLPLAYDLNYAEINGSIRNYIGQSAVIKSSATYQESTSTPYAFAIDWADYGAPSVLYQLMQQNLIVRVSHKGFNTMLNGKTINHRIGTLVIPSENQPLPPDQIRSLLKDLSHEYEVNMTEIETGLTPNGFSLGSPSMSTLEATSTAILVGSGVNGYDAGHAWHQIDQNFDMPVTLLDITKMRKRDLGKYTTIIMPDGNYSGINKMAEDIKSWVRSGGNLVACKRAVGWLKSQDVLKIEAVDSPDKSKDQKSYGKRRADYGALVTGGVIVEMDIDLTHPLFYGYTDNKLSTFKRYNDYYKPLEDNYSTPGRYSNRPLQSGYLHKNNAKRLPKTAAVFSQRTGAGRVIGIMDNPNFRGYWWGTSKMFANAILLGQVIR